MATSTDLIGYIAASCTTFAFLPQAWQVIRKHDTHSLSLGMYAIFTAGVCLWGVYGYLRGDWVIVAANIVTGILSATILAIKIKNDVLSSRARK